jgi:phage gpG-like protein
MGVFSPEGFAHFLEGIIPGLAAARHEGLERGAHLLETRAKEAMGTYTYGWPPLKAETVARKATGDSPLLETGAMRDSIHSVIEGHTAVVASDDPKAAWHEFGTVKMPARSFLGEPARRYEAEIVEAMATPSIAVLLGRSIGSTVRGWFGR